MFCIEVLYHVFCAGLNQSVNIQSMESAKSNELTHKRDRIDIIEYIIKSADDVRRSLPFLRIRQSEYASSRLEFSKIQVKLTAIVE